MKPEFFESWLKERLERVVRKERIPAVVGRLRPLLAEYHDLREQNAYLLRVLRGRSVATVQTDTPEPDESQH
jgi:hypothetical protein